LTIPVSPPEPLPPPLTVPVPGVEVVPPSPPEPVPPGFDVEPSPEVDGLPLEPVPPPVGTLLAAGPVGTAPCGWATEEAAGVESWELTIDGAAGGLEWGVEAR
jgi:hypothetical protein